MSIDSIRKLAAEFIGTFLFVTVIVNVVANGCSFAPVAIGVALMAMVYATAAVSGGHLNPAVTLGLWLRGAIKFCDVIPYFVAQVAGAAAAAGVMLAMQGDTGVMGVAVKPSSFEVVPALIAEFIFTFALVFTVLQVATAKKTAGNSYFGFAIGATVLIGASAVGSISGGAFNPAVAVGVCTAKLVAWEMIWVYLVANLAAGAVAAFAFKFLNPEDCAKA